MDVATWGADDEPKVDDTGKCAEGVVLKAHKSGSAKLSTASQHEDCSEVVRPAVSVAGSIDSKAPSTRCLHTTPDSAAEEGVTESKEQDQRAKLSKALSRKRSMKIGPAVKNASSAAATAHSAAASGKDHKSCKKRTQGWSLCKQKHAYLISWIILNMGITIVLMFGHTFRILDLLSMPFITSHAILILMSRVEARRQNLTPATDRIFPRQIPAVAVGSVSVPSRE